MCQFCNRYPEVMARLSKTGISFHPRPIVKKCNDKKVKPNDQASKKPSLSK